MSGSLRIAYFAHSLRSDWNNGNAHFLRGLLREMGTLGHDVSIFEPSMEWSIENLLEQPAGEAALAQFRQIYPELRIETYEPTAFAERDVWRQRLRGIDVVMVHEWNAPELAHALLALREELGHKPPLTILCRPAGWSAVTRSRRRERNRCRGSAGCPTRSAPCSG